MNTKIYALFFISVVTANMIFSGNEVLLLTGGKSSIPVTVNTFAELYDAAQRELNIADPRFYSQQLKMPVQKEEVFEGLVRYYNSITLSVIDITGLDN